jgi:hypothetical protein
MASWRIERPWLGEANCRMRWISCEASGAVSGLRSVTMLAILRRLYAPRAEL